MTDLDPRLTPARGDIAARRLEGLVAAERFVEGTPARIVEGVVPLRRAPRPDAGLDTEALMGETVTVYDEDDEGWSWVQLDRDGYVGWVPSHGLLKHVPVTFTHRVTALRSFVYPAASIKEPPLHWLSLGSRLAVRSTREVNGRLYAVTSEGGVVVANHLAPLDATESDPVAVAERFLGTPYLWGGRSSLGLDCSGLVQTAFEACGTLLPRDADLQEQAAGTPVSLDPATWRRGDLLFWPGHVAIVRDPTSFIHANAWMMAVGIEETSAGLARIAASGSPLRSVRRV